MLNRITDCNAVCEQRAHKAPFDLDRVSSGERRGQQSVSCGCENYTVVQDVKKVLNKQNPGRSIYVPKAPVLCVPCIGVVVAPMFSKDVKITHVRTYSCFVPRQVSRCLYSDSHGRKKHGGWATVTWRSYLKPPRSFVGHDIAFTHSSEENERGQTRCHCRLLQPGD